MTLVGRLDLVVPPLALMGLIFFLSAQPDLSSGLGAWDVLLRKLAHAGVYAVLTLLWWRALRDIHPAHPAAGHRTVAGAWLIAIAYSATDEWHQTFVTGRHGSPVDVLIDAAGASAAALWALRRT
jgi:VanZ family protein